MPRGRGGRPHAEESVEKWRIETKSERAEKGERERGVTRKACGRGETRGAEVAVSVSASRGRRERLAAEGTEDRVAWEPAGLR